MQKSQDSNLGPLDEKRECYLSAMQPPNLTKSWLRAGQVIDVSEVIEVNEAREVRPQDRPDL